MSVGPGTDTACIPSVSLRISLFLSIASRFPNSQLYDFFVIHSYYTWFFLSRHSWFPPVPCLLAVMSPLVLYKAGNRMIDQLPDYFCTYLRLLVARYSYTWHFAQGDYVWPAAFLACAQISPIISARSRPSARTAESLAKETPLGHGSTILHDLAWGSTCHCPD